MKKFTEMTLGDTPAHKRAVRAVAELRGVPMSQIVRECIESHLGLPPEPEPDSRCIVEALATDWHGDLMTELAWFPQPGVSETRSTTGPGPICK